jgi:putative endonuclease
MKQSIKKYYVYIITNKNNSVLYTCFTNNLTRRIFEHRNKVFDSFSKKYNLEKLIYFETYNSKEKAEAREKQIKAGSRARKIKLIESINENWIDISDRLLFPSMLGGK